MDSADLRARSRKMLGILCEAAIDLHGLILAQAGQPILEVYLAPGAAEIPHRLYSVSKSVTSLAIGILYGRGLTDLDARGADLFPEWIGPDTPPDACAVTLRDMLRMATCHSRRAHKEEDFSWAKAFFDAPSDHAPGTVFGYDSTGTQILTLLCRRITGKTMLEFLQAELFDKIGATDPKHWLTDLSGIEQGGSGLHMTLRDLCKTANFCMTDGLGIVPAEYMRLATSRQIDTGMKTGEQRFGYGYQFWMTRDGFAMLGKDGQMALMVPHRQLVLCTTGDTQYQPEAVQQIIDAFYDCVLPNGEEENN